jgi:hypothetical protein
MIQSYICTSYRVVMWSSHVYILYSSHVVQSYVYILKSVMCSSDMSVHLIERSYDVQIYYWITWLLYKMYRYMIGSYDRSIRCTDISLEHMVCTSYRAAMWSSHMSTSYRVVMWCSHMPMHLIEQSCYTLIHLYILYSSHVIQSYVCTSYRVIMWSNHMSTSYRIVMWCSHMPIHLIEQSCYPVIYLYIL